MKPTSKEAAGRQKKYKQKQTKTKQHILVDGQTNKHTPKRTDI